MPGSVSTPDHGRDDEDLKDKVGSAGVLRRRGEGNGPAAGADDGCSWTATVLCDVTPCFVSWQRRVLFGATPHLDPGRQPG